MVLVASSRLRPVQLGTKLLLAVRSLNGVQRHQCAGWGPCGQRMGLPRVTAQLGADPGAPTNLHQLPSGLKRPPRGRVCGSRAHARPARPGLPPDFRSSSLGPPPPAQCRGPQSSSLGLCTCRILRDTLPTAPPPPGFNHTVDTAPCGHWHILSDPEATCPELAGRGPLASLAFGRLSLVAGRSPREGGCCPGPLEVAQGDRRPQGLVGSLAFLVVPESDVGTKGQRPALSDAPAAGGWELPRVRLASWAGH